MSRQWNELSFSLLALVLLLAPASAGGPPAMETNLAPSVAGADLPYAVRAKRLLGLLGHMEATQGKNLDPPPTHRALETLGLDPESAAGVELLEASRRFRESYDRSLKARNGLPLEGQRRMEEASCRLAGRLMGEWLQTRRAEGWAADPLLQRLLNSPYWGSTSGTTGSLEELKNNLDACADHFNRALAVVSPEIPRSFRHE